MRLVLNGDRQWNALHEIAVRRSLSEQTIRAANALFRARRPAMIRQRSSKAMRSALGIRAGDLDDGDDAPHLSSTKTSALG